MDQDRSDEAKTPARMEDVEGIEGMVPLPHEGGFPPVPTLEQMEEDERGDPADETMHRQTPISTRRDQFEGPDLAPDRKEKAREPGGCGRYSEKQRI